MYDLELVNQREKPEPSAVHAIRILRALSSHGDFFTTMLGARVLLVSAKVSRKGRRKNSQEVA